MENISRVFQKKKQKKKQEIEFHNSFKIEFLLPFTGCIKVFGKIPAFVLIAAFLMSSSLIDSNRTGWTFSNDQLIKISSEVQLFCLSTTWEIVFWSNGSMPWLILFVSIFNAALMLPFSMISVWTFLIFQQLLMDFERLGFVLKTLLI